jgi:hypothetical protein
MPSVAGLRRVAGHLHRQALRLASPAEVQKRAVAVMLLVTLKGERLLAAGVVVLT